MYSCEQFTRTVFYLVYLKEVELHMVLQNWNLKF